MITVNVTQEDIDKGIGWIMCSDCPVALAVTGATGQPFSAGIDFLTRESDSFQIPIPLIAQVFIMAFDHGTKVSPFTFSIEDLPPVGGGL